MEFMRYAKKWQAFSKIGKVKTARRSENGFVTYGDMFVGEFGPKGFTERA
jgi:hypothetical protein